MRNSKVAHIFATRKLHNRIGKVNQDFFHAIADPTGRSILALIEVQELTPDAMTLNELENLLSTLNQ